MTTKLVKVSADSWMFPSAVNSCQLNADVSDHSIYGSSWSSCRYFLNMVADSSL